jgi:hypothetical protein
MKKGILFIFIALTAVSCSFRSEWLPNFHWKNVPTFSISTENHWNSFTLSWPTPFKNHPDEEEQKPITKKIIHDQEGVVEVVMRVAENGQWKVVNLSATNEELARYVVSKLKEYHPQTPDKAVGQVVKYRFVFKQQA